MSDTTPGAVSLVDEVYAELRQIAARYMRREHARSVEATELVHEAYVRMAQGRPVAFENRGHFVALAAIAMRRLLVERARRRHAAKRGGKQLQVTLNDALLVDEGLRDGVDLVALDLALGRLADLDPGQARIVELRFFGGLSIEETAEAMALSPATVKRHWTLARAWLLRELERERP
jgi:RNA polymerase sigma factor (TIGR02999 family)